MKRLLFLIGMTVVVVAFASVVMTPDIGMADRPSPSKQQQSFYWSDTLDDSTAAGAPDTNSTPRNSSDKLMNFTDADRYGTVHGWYVLEYTGVDTGASGVLADTANDTVDVQFFTSNEDGTPNKLIYTNKVAVIHGTAGVLNADYVGFTLSDSVLWDNTYLRVISQCWDSTAAKVRINAAIHYKVTVKQYGK